MAGALQNTFVFDERAHAVRPLQRFTSDFFTASAADAQMSCVHLWFQNESRSNTKLATTYFRDCFFWRCFSVFELPEIEHLRDRPPQPSQWIQQHQSCHPKSSISWQRQDNDSFRDSTRAPLRQPDESESFDPRSALCFSSPTRKILGKPWPDLLSTYLYYTNIFLS